MRAHAAAMLWDALEGMQMLTQQTKQQHGLARAIKIVAGDFEENGDGTHDASVLLDRETGLLLIAAADRIIRERLVALGQMDVSESGGKS